MEESTSLDRLFEIMTEMVEEQKRFNEKVKQFSNQLDKDTKSDSTKEEIIANLNKLLKKSFE